MKRLFFLPAFAAVAAFAAQPSLEDGFANPPKENRPQVWWWFDATAPDAAITRDLEGLKRVGVSGFHIYGGSVTGKGWLPRVKWALHEANRLGLDGIVTIGAAGCGHRETDPRHAQKDLVFTEAKLDVREAAGAAAPHAVKLPRKGVKETPKNADGSPKYYWDIAVFAVPDTTNDVPLAEVRDVSRCLDRATDVFAWPDAPAGKWRIFRVGYVPKVFGWMGCYIDHMSKEAFDAHWARVMAPLLAALAPDERAALKGVMCDSWEAGTVSWTDTFAEEFRRRRGYDILPWLPVKAGARLGTKPRRSRFLRDFRETVSELIAENHYAYQKEVANRHGLVSIAEAAGPHQRQGDVRRMQGRCDVAMGEFWMPSGHRPADTQRFMVRDAATAAHVYGIREVLAEAFTTINTYWTESPRTMKPCADRAFCDGLTRVCYHGMKLSPSLTDKPGFIRNVGTHYNPQTTWFDQSGAFNLYLARCSWMLSQGRFAADCLLYAGDAIGLFAGMKTPDDGLGAGYDYDLCPTELLEAARVENGEIVLPCGGRYRVLAVCDRNPDTVRNMRPRMIKIEEFPAKPAEIGEVAGGKIRDLAAAGATVLRSREERLAWGRAHRPDFVSSGGEDIDWIHRILQDGTDVYFVANRASEPRVVGVSFRAARGRVPELWDAVSGIRRTGTFSLSATGEEVALDLPPYGSTFVVFRRMPGGGSHAAERGDAAVVRTVGGGWKVRFDPAWGGPAVPVSFATLEDWSKRPENGIRHYSGVAVYEKTLAVGAVDPGTRVELDLGDVRETAEVRVNGVPCGTVWTSPYRVDVTDAVRGRSGNAKIEVSVANLWPNRLIGDASLPPDKRFTRTNINRYRPGDSLLPSGLLGPVTLRLSRK